MPDVGHVSIKDEAISRTALHHTERYTNSAELSLRHAVEEYKDITLSAAQLDALAATPVSLIAAPGAGKLTMVTGVVGFNDFGTAAYAGSSQLLSIKYTNGSGALISVFSEAFGEAAADLWEIPAVVLCVPVVNAAIVASTNADWTTGDGVIYLRLYYRTVTAALNNTP